MSSSSPVSSGPWPSEHSTALLALADRCFPGVTHKASSFFQMRMYWIARDDDSTVLAMAGLYELHGGPPDPTHYTPLMLSTLCVHPDYRRRGLAARLVREIRQSNVGRAIRCNAWIFDGDRSLVRGYQSCGAALLEERKSLAYTAQVTGDRALLEYNTLYAFKRAMRPGAIILLVGPGGCGKTFLRRSMQRAAGVRQAQKAMDFDDGAKQGWPPLMHVVYGPPDDGAHDLAESIQGTNRLLVIETTVNGDPWEHATDLWQWVGGDDPHTFECRRSGGKTLETPIRVTGPECQRALEYGYGVQVNLDEQEELQEAEAAMRAAQELGHS
jgi:GNAT superfamily N-acetyltransferase